MKFLKLIHVFKLIFQFRLQRINADNQNKKQVIIFWVIFFIHILAVGLLSLALPQPFLSISNQSQLSKLQIQNCTNYDPVTNQINSDIICQTFNESQKIGLLMLDITKQNQFGLIYVNIYLTNIDIPLIIEEQVQVSLYDVQIQRKLSYQIINIQNQIARQDNKVYWNPNGIYQDEQKNVYLSQMVGYINQFEHQNLFLSLKFNLNLSKYSNVKSMELEANIVNQKYTQYSIIIRLCYFLISSISSTLFIRNILKLSFNLVAVQQKIVGLLSILLAMFNDPLYAVTVLYPNWFRQLSTKNSSFLSVFFVVNFIVGLFFSWVIFLDRIVYEDGSTTTKQLKTCKFIWMGLLYICLLTIYQLYANDQLHQNLIFSYNQIYQNKYLGLLIFTLTLFGIGACYIVIQYVRIFINFNKKMWRNKIFSVFTLFFTFLVIVMFYMGSFQLYEYQSSRLLIIYAAINLYILSLQFLYSPTNKQSKIQNRHSLNQVQFQEVISGQSKQVINVQQKEIVIEQQKKMNSEYAKNIAELNTSQNRKKRKRKIDRKIKESKNQEINSQQNNQKQI